MYAERLWTANEIKNQVQTVLFSPSTGKYFSYGYLILEFEEGDEPYDSCNAHVMVSLGNFQAAYFHMGSLINGGKAKMGLKINALNSEVVITAGQYTLTQAFEIDENGTGPDLQIQFLGSGTNPTSGTGNILVKFNYNEETFGTNL